MLQVDVLFCPSCMKNGITTNRLKLYQINLNEAVYLCPQESCKYPEGHKVIYVQRHYCKRKPKNVPSTTSSLSDFLSGPSDTEQDLSVNFDFDNWFQKACDEIDSNKNNSSLINPTNELCASSNRAGINEDLGNILGKLFIHSLYSVLKPRRYTP